MITEAGTGTLPRAVVMKVVGQPSPHFVAMVQVSLGAQGYTTRHGWIRLPNTENMWGCLWLLPKDKWVAGQ